MTCSRVAVQMTGPKTASLEIYGEIGPASLGLIDAKSVSAKLKSAGELDAVEVRINSVGGSAFEGLAICNLLKEHPAKVNVVIDSVAASAASLIAMAGDSVRIPANAMLMIHDPYTIVVGGATELRQAAEMLGSVKQAAIATYAGKSKQPAEKIANWMKEEKWFVGQEAVDAGFADTTGEATPKAATAQLAAGMALMFRNFPAAALANMSYVELENVQYEREYRDNPHLAKLMNLDDYIASRRIDDGLDLLCPKGANPLVGNSAQPVFIDPPQAGQRQPNPLIDPRLYRDGDFSNAPCWPS